MAAKLFNSLDTNYIFCNCTTVSDTWKMFKDREVQQNWNQKERGGDFFFLPAYSRYSEFCLLQPTHTQYAIHMHVEPNLKIISFFGKGSFCMNEVFKTWLDNLVLFFVLDTIPQDPPEFANQFLNFSRLVYNFTPICTITVSIWHLLKNWTPTLWLAI